MSTHDLSPESDPGQFRRHRFGVPADRWARLTGRTYWVTGAGTGFGQALAVALACAGSRVFLTGRRPEKLVGTVAIVRALGGTAERCHVVPADITDAGQVRRACAVIAGRSAALDGLVHSAAIPQRRECRWPLLQGGLDTWQQMLTVNVTAPLLVTSAALPLLLRAEGVRVLLLTSEAGWAATCGFGPYNVSKAALNSLGASLAEECAARYPARDVQINVLVPGEARTEMNQGSDRSPYTLAAMALLLLTHPAGGPNGRFFHADGRHLAFGHAAAHDHSLLNVAQSGPPASSPTPSRLRVAMSRCRGLLRRCAVRLRAR